LFTGLIFFGCNQEAEITSPEDTGSYQQYELISLPPPSSGAHIESQTQTKIIDGEEGGSFYAEFGYQSSTGMVYQVSYLDFEEEAFEGTKTISKTFSTTGAAMIFGPPMQFEENVKYTYKVSGLDLTGVNPNTLDFVYIDASGNIYSVQYNSIAIDKNSGTLAVYGANLPHFSRYGFVNSAE
jgi:hypothetical protein